MGSRVNVCSVAFLNNPSAFTDEFKLEITFEVFEHLPGDLEWKLVYVGSGESKEYDQELDSALVGPTPEGKHKFTFTAPAPDATKIPVQDVVGVSVLLLKLKYNDSEFLNLGWWVSNEYPDEEMRENPPATPQIDKLIRTVKHEDTRVTTYPIRWTDTEVEEEPPVEEELVDEADLLPLQDDEKEDEDLVDEDEEEGEGNDEGDIDLDSSANETAQTNESLSDSVVVKTSADEGDEPMDESTENGGGMESLKLAETGKEAGDAPLGDMTNE